MQQGELSKVALFSVADYTWNMYGFDNMTSWRAALSAIVGDERTEPFQLLVPYLRYYDAKTPLAQLIDEFKASYTKDASTASSKSLQEELLRIEEACGVIESMATANTKSDRLFYADLRPWLTKLKAMAVHGNVMLKALTDSEDTRIDRVTFAKSWSAIEGIEKNENHQFDILKGMGTSISLSIQTAEPAAQSLRPFLDWLLKQLEEKK